MNKVQSENSSHNATVTAALATHQNTITASSSVATVKAADIAFYRAALASAVANSVNGEQFITALKELGTGGV